MDDYDDDHCPCRQTHPFRWLQEEEEEEDAGVEDDVKLWEVIYTCGVLLFMFAALISDRIGADSVMMISLTALMAARIITVAEGLQGFSNEGLMTVLTLFVVADGISKTGALDWYMGKLLGRPKSVAAAQMKLMIPISIVSAFLNNTPVVAVMIPIVQRWAKNIRISVQQLLIPLSFASILGGTCTLIGTSTNLVVAELLVKRYPNDPTTKIGLFDLGIYGVPIAIAGVCYILLASTFLLPGGARKRSQNETIIPQDNQEDILIGARLAPWSPAAGRSVKRSGLRDTGGIYLVSVHRAATGNVHRAVGQEFVLNVGDILYFTGLVESFGDFCQENGLEVLTSENENDDSAKKVKKKKEGSKDAEPEEPTVQGSNLSLALTPVVEGELEGGEIIPCEVGVTMQSLMQADEAERSRGITRMIDLIRGQDRDEPTAHNIQTGCHQVVVTSESELVVVGVNANDRPGLLLDISKGLLRLNLSLRHTEASVVQSRSISIWRCELINSELPDLEEIWSVLTALLENDRSRGVKQRGLRVIRAAVTKNSSLIGKRVAEIDFRQRFKAAIIAVQKGGRNVSVSNVVFGSGDIIVLQTDEDSPLLKTPPKDFYKHLKDIQKDIGTGSRSRSSSISSFQKKPSVASLVGMITKSKSNESSEQKVKSKETDIEAQNPTDKVQNISIQESDSDDGLFFIDGDDSESVDYNDETREDGEVVITSMHEIIDEDAWKDLQIVAARETNDNDDGVNSREFLTAMSVAPKSRLVGRTVAEIGLDKLTGVFLVSIDRPNPNREGEVGRPDVLVTISPTGTSSVTSSNAEASESLRSVEQVVNTISTDTPLMEDDVLWFAGSAHSLGDLRKIPGLVSTESEEVDKINDKIHDRRLVEAVVARRGPLVGKSVKDIRFRTRYGAAVIAVHRDGTRVMDHPGKIKLQAGDVLLLEAGPTFISKSVDNDRSFALLAEVKDSAPPRLRLLIPALIITVAMLTVFTANVGVSLFVCALVASILMVTLGILSEQEARDAVNWEVYITIAAAFGIGTALVNSGVAGGMANALVTVGEGIGIGDAGLLGAVYFATFLISNVVTNNAAAALLFPIALDAADQTGVDKLVMSYCLMLGASASFMSPFGYTTNLLIYGPGGYKYKDFLLIGTPMQVVLWLLSIFLLSYLDGSNWWLIWGGMFLLLILVVGFQIFDLSKLISRFRRKTKNNFEEGVVDTEY